MFVAAPNCVSAAIIFDQDGQPVENTFHYHLGSPADIAALTAMANTMDTYCAANRGSWPTNVGVLKYYLRALDTQSSPSFEKNPAAPIAGSNPGTAFPNDVTLSITRYTGLAGRKNRGRIYWVGITEGDMATANSVAITHAATRIAWCNGLMAAMAAGATPATEIILHKSTGTYVPVVGYRVADYYVDNQRRRLPAHNIHH